MELTRLPGLGDFSIAWEALEMSVQEAATQNEQLRAEKKGKELEPSGRHLLIALCVTLKHGRATRSIAGGGMTVATS
jgi:hypothetical protein